MSEGTEARVRKLFVEHLCLESEEGLTPESRVEEDCGGDSLDCVELVMATEEEFGIEITDPEAEQLKTLGDYTAIVDRKLGA